jgi:hypothetical protein
MNSAGSVDCYIYKCDWVWSIEVNLTIVQYFTPDHCLEITIRLRTQEEYHKTLCE